MIAWESYPITVMGREGSFQPQKKLGQDDEEQKPSWMTEEEWQEYLRKKRMKQQNQGGGIGAGMFDMPMNSGGSMGDYSSIVSGGIASMLGGG